MFDAVTLDDLARAGRADRRFVSVLLTACAILALLLAAVGIYGLTAAWFQSRRKELGVRVALGASPASLMRSVMAGSLLHSVFGVVIGIVLAAVAGRALRAILYGVGPNDLAALAFSATLMLAVAALAAWLPARRALRIDPVEHLRSEFLRTATPTAPVVEVLCRDMNRPPWKGGGLACTRLGNTAVRDT